MKGNTLSFVVTLVSVAALAIVFTILFVNSYKMSKEEIEQGRRDIEFIDKEIDIERKARADKINGALVAGKTFGIVVSVVVFAFFIFSVINRINGNKIVIGNTTHIVIETGSMSAKNDVNDYLITYNLNNQFGANSIIEVEKVEEENLYVYDVVAFKNDVGQTVIHRIINVEIKDGELRYVTRGDANNASDSYRPVYEDLIGRYNGNKVDHVGILIIFFQSNAGIITVISIFYILTLLVTLSEKLSAFQRERTDRLLSVIDFDFEDDDTFPDHDFVQNIYYQGIVYRFKNNSFLGKEEISDPVELERYDEENQLVQTTTDESGETVVSKTIIDPTKEENEQ